MALFEYYPESIKILPNWGVDLYGIGIVGGYWDYKDMDNRSASQGYFQTKCSTLWKSFQSHSEQTWNAQPGLVLHNKAFAHAANKNSKGPVIPVCSPPNATRLNTLEQALLDERP